MHVRVESRRFNRQMAFMPSIDPTPPLEPLKRQFLKIMRWGTLFSLAIAAMAVVLVAQGDDTFHIHMLIATGLGVGLSVLLGIALMTLVFLSNRMGQDADAAHHFQKDKNDDRP
jgi:uncharacterized membrane protein